MPNTRKGPVLLCYPQNYSTMYSEEFKDWARSKGMYREFDGYISNVSNLPLFWEAWQAAEKVGRESSAKRPLTRRQIDDVMTNHYPLSSLRREEVDAFEACVRDLERLHGIDA